tara:strand:- start:5163 stop:5882 length:720 start_codon:yes stop_codon:yes gene_type:complete
MMSNEAAVLLRLGEFDDFGAFRDVELEDPRGELFVGLDLAEDKVIAVPGVVDIQDLLNAEVLFGDTKVQRLEHRLWFSWDQTQTHLTGLLVVEFTLAKGKTTGGQTLDLEGLLEIATAPQELKGHAQLRALDSLLDFDLCVVGIVHPQGATIINEVLALWRCVLKAHHRWFAVKETTLLLLFAAETRRREDLTKVCAQILCVLVKGLDAVDDFVEGELVGGLRILCRDPKGQEERESTE